MSKSSTTSKTAGSPLKCFTWHWAKKQGFSEELVDMTCFHKTYCSTCMKTGFLCKMGSLKKKKKKNETVKRQRGLVVCPNSLRPSDGWQTNIKCGNVLKPPQATRAILKHLTRCNWCLTLLKWHMTYDLLCLLGTWTWLDLCLVSFVTMLEIS